MKDTKDKNETDLKGFAGHSVTLSNKIDDEITRIGRGTPAGGLIQSCKRCCAGGHTSGGDQASAVNSYSQRR